MRIMHRYFELILALLIFLTYLHVLQTYESLPSIITVTYDTLGRPIYGLKEEVLINQILPVLIISTILSLSLILINKNITNLIYNILSRVIDFGHYPKNFLHILQLGSLYIVILGWWISDTVLKSVAQNTPIHTSLLVSWYLAGLLAFIIVSVMYLLISNIDAKL